MLRTFSLLAASAAAALLTLPAAAQEITLRAIAFIPKTHPLMAQTQVWVNDVNAALKGKLRINYVGGPEVIPGLQQADAVGKGVIDLAFNPTAYYQSTFPEGGALILSRKSTSEERAPGGLYDFMVKRHERINVRYIGRALWSPFYLWTSTKVTNIDGLKGQKMRTSALYDRFMQALGIVPVTIPEGETYTALEGGTVTGFGWPMAGPRERGWIKSAKFLIDLPFYASNNIVIIMNLDKWKALPEDVRKEIERVTAAFEPKMVEHYQKAEAEEWALLEKAGVQKIKFSEAENKRYIDTAYKVEWDNLATKVPDIVGELRKLTGN
jgi:TRAP-type C4-dicarboxylate transport system substrate-binding protein